VARFILDSSIWIHIWKNQPPEIWVRFWEQLDLSIADGDIESPQEVLEELKAGTDGLPGHLAAREGLFAPLDDELQLAVSDVVEACPDLFDSEAERNRADPFVVALAKVRGAIVVTNERPRKAPTGRRRIPDACTELHIPCTGWPEFLRAIRWEL
jgi:hypothetical protein